MTANRRQRFVESLARSNQAFYDTPDGRNMLRLFELTFEHRWIYVFELVQNALDAGARSIAFQCSDDGDCLTFQHDGQSALGEPEVEGLSKLFRSTKGATTVGFMGIGFKSVFGRFREARISGWGWTLRYEMREITGRRYGDVQTDPLGAVLPIWDDSVPEPDRDFTTRFQFNNRLDHGVDLRSDVDRLLPDDPTLLAILAESNLQRVHVDGCVWELGIDEQQDGSRTATARCADDVWQWQLFSAQFQPSRPAIARLLEHRQIRPDELPEREREEVYAAAARPRRVLGVLPLDDQGRPDPPQRGQLYATLPTEVTLALGLHINADWLLNISRTGLRGIEDDPWQRDIADRIADVLKNFLLWVARTCSDPDAAARAFAALASPSRGSGRVDAILADERWLSRLRDLLQDTPVVPVWTTGSDALSFAPPRDAIVPPAPLAAAFEDQPSLKPATLLNGCALVRRVLGSGGRELMNSAGLLREMPPKQLERVWANGLEPWWKTLDGDGSVRRDLLFHLWAAVSKLTSETGWTKATLPCVRAADGAWRTIADSAFFRDRLPSDREPGGIEVRGFLQPFIDRTDYLAEGWIHVLRQGAGKDRDPAQHGHLRRAWHWIETHARGIGLRELVQNAIDVLDASEAPDWSVLVPLGRWALRRNRRDLLLRVLVESDAGRRGIPLGRALLSKPYVRDHDRCLLFPGLPVVSAAYLEDAATADPREWRVFFEQAGVQGAVAVRAVDGHAGQGDKETVSQFLGVDVGTIGWSNAGGYTLRDFDIEPSVPDTEVSEEHRRALSAWLDDSFGALRGKGRRTVHYSYYGNYSRQGQISSAWVRKLSDLAWVPSHDGSLKQPREVLSQRDPAREGAPTAALSDALLSVLEQEGVRFGVGIPAATPLRRLATTGSQLPAEDLAALFREIRDQGLTDDDARRFEQALLQVQIPCEDGRRVPLNHIVQSVGGGRLRGALGDRILPLARFHPQLVEELEHDDFPYVIPETTTGEQALAYLREVWQRARQSPTGLANDVRNVLPLAYAYCLEDCGDDPSLRERWAAGVLEAAVFTDREWVVLANAANIYFDDVDDRRFIPQTVNLRTVTAGHLGNSPADQHRTAKALDLPPLSSAVTMEWFGQDGEPAPGDWIQRFDLICGLLRWVRSHGDKANGEAGAVAELALRRSADLRLKVSFAGAPAEYIPVNARLHENVLTVAASPLRWGADAAKELLRHAGFRQRAELAADLTGMLMAIDADEEFLLAADKFRRSFASDFVHTPSVQPDTRSGEHETTAETGRDPSQTPDPAGTATAEREATEPASPQDTPSEDAGQRDAGTPADEPKTHQQPRTPADDDPAAARPPSGSYTRARALARQEAIAKTLRSALKGEIAPPDDDKKADDRQNEGGPRGDGTLGDEVYREIAAMYERANGRDPEIGDPSQTGWDLRSSDPKAGTMRLIEVKGKGCPWEQDEVVELSRAQVHKAFETLDNRTPRRSWYLYVVERTDDRRFRVLPIENPVRVASTWILSGESWREIAEEPRLIAVPDDEQR